jgi:hypothetical protein
MNDLFFLSAGGPYGDPIAEISEYKDGYLLKSYGPEGVCLAFDYISKEDGDELIKFKDNPSKAFGGCGAEEVFCHQYTRLKEYQEYENIIQAIISVHGDEVAKFMNRVATKMNMYDFYDYMEESLIKDYGEVDNWIEEIKAKPTFFEQCNLYDYYKHA